MGQPLYIFISLLVGIIGMDMASPLALPYGTKKWVINFYYEQLDYFNKVGLGNRTTHDVKVTPQLIEITKKRLSELTVAYEAKLTPQAKKLREYQKGRLNGQLNSNGTIAAPRVQGNGNAGHGRDKS